MFFYYHIFCVIILLTLSHSAEPINFTVNPLYPCSISISPIELARKKDLDLFVLTLQIPHEVKRPQLKDKYYMDLFNFSLDSTYRIPTTNHNKFINFKFIVDPLKDSLEGTTYLCEHKLLSQVLRHFCHNLYIDLIGQSPLSMDKKHYTEVSRNPNEFLESSQDIRYYHTLKNLCKDTHTDLEKLAKMDVIELDRLIRSINHIANEEGKFFYHQQLLIEEKIKMSDQLTLSLTNKEKYYFEIKYRNPRNKGLTTISVRMFENETSPSQSFIPYFQGSIENFILTNFYDLISYKFRETLVDINRELSFAKEYPQSSPPYVL